MYDELASSSKWSGRDLFWRLFDEASKYGAGIGTRGAFSRGGLVSKVEPVNEGDKQKKASSTRIFISFAPRQSSRVFAPNASRETFAQGSDGRDIAGQSPEDFPARSVGPADYLGRLIAGVFERQ